MEKEAVVKPARKSRAKAKDVKEPKARVVRMSKRAELQVHNGIVPEAPLQKEELEVQLPEVPVVPEVEVEVEGEAPLEAEQQVPVIVDDVPNTENILTIIEDVQPKRRKVSIVASIDQKGLRLKNELVDPENNTWKKIVVELEGETMDIAKAAGRIANDIHDWYGNLRGSKGIKRAAGFNINLDIVDETSSTNSLERFTSIAKMRLSNPIDMAFAIGSSILTQLESDNADNLLTGDFKVSKDGEMFLGKLKFNAEHLKMPLFKLRQMINERKIQIKNNVKENAQRMLNNK